MIGSAVTDEPGNILYLSEVEIRNDIASTMKARAALRRNRRQRNTRYRPARWLNRRNSIKTERFSPTMRSKIEAHLREIRFVQRLLPITSIALETGTFDPYALKNPEVLQHKWMYQRGMNYGYVNTKAYVLTRDDQDHIHCLVKSKPKISPLAIVRKLKQASTSRLWQRYEVPLTKHFWKERTFWSDGYFCCTIGNASEEAIRLSIANQG